MAPRAKPARIPTTIGVVETVSSSQHVGSFVQGRMREHPVGVDTRLDDSRNCITDDAKTQTEYRGDSIDNSRILIENGSSEYSPGEADIPRSGVGSSKDLPRHLVRLIEGRHRGAVRGQRTRPNPRWPSHCPTIDICEYKALFEKAANYVKLREQHQRVKVLMKQLTGLGENARQQKANNQNVKTSAIGQKTLRQLIRAKVVVAADVNAIVNTFVFLVPEHAKERNRIVAWPIWANSHEYNWDHNVAYQAEPVDIARDIHTAQFAATFDLKASYYQIALPAGSEEAFVFEVNGKKFKWVRLPMGYSRKDQQQRYDFTALILTSRKKR